MKNEDGLENYHIGQLIEGVVKRSERGDYVFGLPDGLEAVIPRGEQFISERFAPGDAISAVIVDVNRQPKGYRLVASRADPELLKRLVEREVPEIRDGRIVIKSAARLPGELAKIAVHANEAGIDAVNVCRGTGNARILRVTKELHGEKVDVVEWSEDTSVFVASALLPATGLKIVNIDYENRHIEVIAPADQLSLSIGKRGRNVRLAGDLTGWRIDIKSEDNV
jgi:transcription termination/antitermination protein NusA